MYQGIISEIKYLLEGSASSDLYFIEKTFYICKEIEYRDIYNIYKENDSIYNFTMDKIKSLQKILYRQQDFNIKPNTFNITYHFYELPHRAAYELRLTGIKIDE